MSKFEDNPFGEPMVDNPFADPVNAQQAARANNATVILDDYNPFDEDEKSNNKSQYMAGGTNPMAPKSPPQIPAYNQSAGGHHQQPSTNQAYGSAGSAAPQISTAELQRRQEELEQKAAELERRENALRNNSNGTRRNNWPPLPEKCCFQPCFYQDIGVEIPSEFQRIVRHLYYLWMFYAAVMAVNILGGMALMFHEHNFSAFGLAILYAFMFTPASFMCWYRPAYKAFRSDSSFNFMVFFFIFFFQMIILVVQTVGIYGSGYCGFITALSQFDGTPSGIIMGLFLLCIAISFAICTAGNVMLLTKIHSIYRHSDTVNMKKAQAEFTNEFMHNQHVQRAAANATSAAVSSQFGGGTSANRY